MDVKSALCDVVVRRVPSTFSYLLEFRCPSGLSSSLARDFD
jgi:hypothetical protein